MLCILMKILSHTSVKKKTKRLKVSNFALLLVIFKWHHGSEGVNVEQGAGREDKERKTKQNKNQAQCHGPLSQSHQI